MNLVAIVTIDDAELNGDDFARMLRSGADEIDQWVFVIRGQPGGEEAARRVIRHIVPDLGACHVVQTAPCGISRARNAGLARLSFLNLTSHKQIVVFPDDDCHFLPGYGASVREQFANDEIDLLITPYGPNSETIDRDRWPLISFSSPTYRELLSLVSSAGISVRGSVFKRIGVFDERLGVGTRLCAGEDVEFALRAKKAGIGIRYEGNIFALHEYKAPRPERVLGNTAVILAYKNFLPGGTYLRALLRAANSGKSILPSPLRAARAWMGARVFSAQPRGDAVGKQLLGGLQLSVAPPSVLLPQLAVQLSDSTRPLESIVAAHITALNSAKERMFLTAFNNADYAMVDGISLSHVSRVIPGQRLEKMATTDFTPALLTRLREASGALPRVAIIGGEPGVARLAGQRLKELGLAEISFSTHGYQSEYASVIDEVNGSRTTVLLVGLGMPAEAIWVDTHRDSIHAAAVVTCGGWLRLLAGMESRAPRVMQKLQLEWAWRLASDPRRTFARYSQGVASVLRAVQNGTKEGPVG